MFCLPECHYLLGALDIDWSRSLNVEAEYFHADDRKGFVQRACSGWDSRPPTQSEAATLSSDPAISVSAGTDPVKYTSPALSSYDISQDELAKAAALMLAEALTANRTISQHMRISTCLVARDSFTPQD